MNKHFIEPYKGLSKETWMLALVSLINRAGAMVVIFLQIYLEDMLGLSVNQIGSILTAYGVGTIIGSWIGGKLTDAFGYYKVMYTSLFLTGLALIGIQYLETFNQFMIGLFVLILIADTFRPAVFVAIDDYSKPENKTRSLTLIRLAINAGYTIGSSFGGAIIFYLGYAALFWIDGLTAIIAATVIFVFLHQKSIIKKKEERKEQSGSKPYQDFKFMLFFFAMMFAGIAFVQFIHLFPLYLKNIVEYNELKIGILLALNGFLIFGTEMPIINKIDKWIPDIKFVFYGMILFGLSFVVLNIDYTMTIIVISILFLTYGEIIGFPYSTTYAIERSKKGNQGEYMAFYSISFSLGHLIGPKLGTYIICHFGYSVLWWEAALMFFIAALFLFWLIKISKKEFIKTNHT